jgi:hypothetical protein
MDKNNADIAIAVQKDRDLSEATQKKLTAAIEAFKAQFKA